MGRKSDTPETEAASTDGGETASQERFRTGAEKLAARRAESEKQEFDLIGFCEAVAARTGIDISKYWADDEQPDVGN